VGHKPRRCSWHCVVPDPHSRGTAQPAFGQPRFAVSGCLLVLINSLSAGNCIRLPVSELKPDKKFFSPLLPSKIIVRSRVGMQAFDGCTALREVELPHCITCIGDAAFWGCSNMTKVVLPNSLTHIDRNAFLECTTLQDVVLPNSLTHIGDSAFSECTALDVRLPKSLTHIGRRAFSGCAGLKDITVSRAGTFVGEGAFSCCTGLKSVILPSVVIGERGDNFDNDGRVDACISDSCFVNCCELTELMLSGEITHVGYRAFSGCASLAVLTLVLNLDLSSTSAPSRLQIASA
jgi:hypothetical protein